MTFKKKYLKAYLNNMKICTPAFLLEISIVKNYLKIMSYTKL